MDPANRESKIRLILFYQFKPNVVKAKHHHHKKFDSPDAVPQRIVEEK
jgi:hypothetical protein